MKITNKIAILFAASLLVLAPMAVTVFAQPSGVGTGKEIGYGAPHNPLGTLKPNVVPILMGHGFALNPSDESQYHVLDVTAMKVSNASQSQTRADLRFEGQPYGLTITGFTDQSLTGNIETLPPRGTKQTGFTPTTVGSISLSMSKYEGVMLATGTITMNSTNYNVLLTSPVIASGGGQHSFNATFRKGNFNGTFGLPNFKGMCGPQNSKR